MAKGSHATRSPDDATVCCVCGRRVLGRQNVRYATSAGIAWHTDTCDRAGWRIYHNHSKGA